MIARGMLIAYAIAVLMALVSVAWIAHQDTRSPMGQLGTAIRTLQP